MSLGATYTVTWNLGDEIQRLGLQRALDALRVNVDFEVNRDTLRMRDGEVPADAKLIVNGWLSEPRRAHADSSAIVANYTSAGSQRSWHTFLDPSHLARQRTRVLYLGVHIIEALFKDIESREDLRAHLRANAPIGARDHATQKRLQALDIPSFFSGCLSLQFPRVDTPRDTTHLVVDDSPLDGDTPPRKQADERVVTQKAEDTLLDTQERVDRRRALAAERLALFARVQRVRTNRLHAYLPCLAMGTAVELVDHQWVERSERFSGLLSLDGSDIEKLRALQLETIRRFLER